MEASPATTTPTDVSEFEREQLRFFLSSSDVISVLSEVNPSLAWLPLLAELNVLRNDAALAIWVERNFTSLDAVRDVANNLRFFKAETARILSVRLNAQRGAIEPLLEKCWRLIIRHIQNSEQGTLQNEWFQLTPRLKREELSADVLERITHIFTPKLFIDKRYGWYDEPDRKIEKPTDVISIKYKVSEGVSESDFLGVWPKDAPAGIEEQLIRRLTNSLNEVLADAVDVGIESSVSLSVSDIDVPSVAAHEQNAFREGFLPIVRVIAELWSRLVKADLQEAKDILSAWQESEYRLVHRLALFAAADNAISPEEAADVLIRLPQGELFLTNSQVEVHRLIRTRWMEFPEEQRSRIEARIADGPPVSWFKEGVDLSRPIDRCRFELLLDLESSNVPMSKPMADLLNEIRTRHPAWIGVEPEKAGFTMWHGSVSPVVGTKEKLASVASDQLIAAAKKAASEADFLEGDSWQGLCQSEPILAFQGIKDALPDERWHEWAWRPLLWAANKIADVDVLNDIAALLVEWPDTLAFGETVGAAAFWIDQVADKLKAPVLWALWDFIERRAPRESEISNNDVFSTALNNPVGNLAAVLLKRTPRIKGQVELGKQLRARYEKLIGGEDTFALLARVRISGAISFLFERAPQWTTAKILPFYDWNSPDALAMWSARKYSNHIGSYKLFDLTKKPFLELFVRPGVPEEDLRAYADWLGFILLANQAGRTSYSLTMSEVRSILRRAGSSSLSTFAHRLAIDMEAAKPQEKRRVWNDIVGPVFQGSWPLDIESQTPNATFKLVQILLATGAAFRSAAPVIMPFIRAESARDHTSIYSLSRASDDFYKAAPDVMLDLLSAVAGEAPDRSLFGLSDALGKLREAAPHLAETRQFKKLSAQASSY